MKRRRKNKIPPMILLYWGDYQKKRFPFRMTLALLSGMLCMVLFFGVAYDFFQSLSAVSEPLSRGFSIITHAGN